MYVQVWCSTRVTFRRLAGGSGGGGIGGGGGGWAAEGAGAGAGAPGKQSAGGSRRGS